MRSLLACTKYRPTALGILLTLLSCQPLQASSQARVTDNSTNSVTLRSSFPPCDALIQAGLKDRLLFPTDDAYDPQISTWWSLNARLRPWCLILPQSTEELSEVVKILHNADQDSGDWHIAVRSGGHHYPGSNNINNGVTIDLSMMNRSTYDAGTGLAKIQPGARWANVYEDLLNWNVTVAGGRDGGVGVGGFLLGGGSTFFMGRRGFACDSVTNFEVVLANGSVINANRSQNSDLWKALKGGGPNFGIVSRYDLDPLPANNISYSIHAVELQYGSTVIDELYKFANLDESENGDDALVVFYQHGSSISNTTTVWYIAVNTAGDTESVSLEGVKAIPPLFKRDAVESLAAAAAGSEVADGTSNVVATATFKNNVDMMDYCVGLHDTFVSQVSDLIGADAFKSYLFLQPLNRYYTDISERRGGNVLGLERSNHSAIMWTGSVTINEAVSAAKVAVIHQLLITMASGIKSYAASTGSDVDLVYQNYADPAQNPLLSYGPTNVQLICEVARKYDPAGFFQNRVPGGFKISRVI